MDTDDSKEIATSLSIIRGTGSSEHGLLMLVQTYGVPRTMDTDVQAKEPVELFDKYAKQTADLKELDIPFDRDAARKRVYIH